MRYGWLGGFVLFVANLFFAGTRSVYACSVCFGVASDDPTNISLRNGVIFLLAVVLVVLAFFAKFFYGIRKRMKLMVDRT